MKTKIKFSFLMVFLSVLIAHAENYPYRSDYL